MLTRVGARGSYKANANPQIGIGGSREGYAPATPPGMRVRTGRFEKLRSRQARHAQSVEVADSKHSLEKTVTIAPPATAIGRHLFRRCQEFCVLR